MMRLALAGAPVVVTLATRSTRAWGNVTLSPGSAGTAGGGGGVGGGGG